MLSTDEALNLSDEAKYIDVSDLTMVGVVIAAVRTDGTVDRVTTKNDECSVYDNLCFGSGKTAVTHTASETVVQLR